MICINKNLNSYKILSNVFSEAEIAQLYIDNKYALPTDEESYQLVKAFSDKPTQIKEGVEELFESNLELANAVYSKILTNSGLSAENLLSLLLKDNLIEKQCS